MSPQEIAIIGSALKVLLAKAVGLTPEDSINVSNSFMVLNRYTQQNKPAAAGGPKKGKV